MDECVEGNKSKFKGLHGAVQKEMEINKRQNFVLEWKKECYQMKKPKGSLVYERDKK